MAICSYISGMPQTLGPPVKRLYLYLPPELAAAVKAAAMANRRSMNGEVIHALDRYVASLAKQKEAA